MISLPPSPTVTTSLTVYGEPHTTVVLQKGPVTQLQPSHHHVKHRDMYPSRRAPLLPLSLSTLENRLSRGLQSSASATHSALVAPSPVPDLRSLHPRQPVSSGFSGTQRSGICDALVCSWPPPMPSPGSPRSSHGSLAGQQTSPCRPLHSLDERCTLPVAFRGSSPPPSSFPTERALTVTKPVRATENALLVPSAPRSFGVFCRPDSAPTGADDDRADSLAYRTPPGLSKPELSRSSPHGSVSSSLALGSQPLRASEHTKAVPPIGAERSHVLSITSPRPHNRNAPPTPQPHALSSTSSWCPSPLLSRLQEYPKNDIDSSNTISFEKCQATVGSANASKQDLERLLRHAVWNKHAPRVVSPLSPLRSSTAPIDVFIDPEYQSRMPSRLNAPSPRYANRPARRARTACDAHPSLDWNTTCTHCPECRRDSVGKRLLACRYRQQQQQQSRHVQSGRFHAWVVDDDVDADDDRRIVRADRPWDVFAHAYAMDEEEKSLWEELAAVMGEAYPALARVGAPCAAAAAYWRVVDDGSVTDGGVHDGHVEMSDEGLLANSESAALFRDVSVY